jgi:hypothetical protein
MIINSKRKVYPSLQVNKKQTTHAQIHATVIACSQNPTKPSKTQPTKRKTILSSMQIGKTRGQK